MKANAAKAKHYEKMADLMASANWNTMLKRPTDPSQGGFGDEGQKYRRLCARLQRMQNKLPKKERDTVAYAAAAAQATIE